MPILRDARVEDALAIARLHVAVWRNAYRDYAPPEVLRRQDEARRCERWLALLAPDDARLGTIVAEVDGVLAGFGHYGPPSDPIFGDLGEVKKLYVATRLARRGIGRALLTAMAERLRAQGYPGVGVGVLAENAPARAFYEALAGTLHARYVDPGPNWRSDNVVYAWRDFSLLLGPGAGST